MLDDLVVSSTFLLQVCAVGTRKEKMPLASSTDASSAAAMRAKLTPCTHHPPRVPCCVRWCG